MADLDVGVDNYTTISRIIKIRFGLEIVVTKCKILTLTHQISRMIKIFKCFK